MESRDASLVSRDPEVMSGAVCFFGARVPVKKLLDYLAWLRLHWTPKLSIPRE
ncbi:DUF433 domain-containing protein [Rhodoferax sp.]|uniref:DUF433 domain-containing protein n=1 Tax=Rhodoferax sp. TaxID=50421 RepID=UPI003784E917